MILETDFDKLFKATDERPIKYKKYQLFRLDRFFINDNYKKILLSFNETNSSWRQAVVLETKGYFKIEGEKYSNSIILWEDTAPKELIIDIYSKDKLVLIYNAWDIGNGVVHYWHNGAAMQISEVEKGRKYLCNDGYPDDDFNDLIFTILWD